MYSQKQIQPKSKTIGQNLVRPSLLIILNIDGSPGKSKSIKNYNLEVDVGNFLNSFGLKMYKWNKY